MRLRRLDLTRFGHFTDFSLDFGRREEGKPDLHIIFGPNEAGKTTAFNGYLDLLFGIPTRSKYNFLHEYETMRVGGSLEIGGEETELVRIKRNKGDLITPSGEAANPALLMQGLDGIDRDQYRAMFSLDDETIEAGGEDILASQGNLGELLFSAAAGLSDLGAVLEAARAEVDLFHKPRKRKTELTEGKRALQELHNQIRELDVPASQFRQLKEQQEIALKLRADAKKTRDDLLKKRERLEAVIECLPLLNTLQKTNETLSDYSNYPGVPAGAQEEARELKAGHVEAATKLRQSKLLLENEKTERESLNPDAKIADVADELTVLLDASRSRAQTAEEDLPKRETELEGFTVDLSRLVGELGLEAPEEGSLPEPLVVQLEEISAKHADAEKNLATAQKEEREAVKKLQLLENEPAVDGKAPLAGHDLDTLLDNLEPETRLSAFAKATEDLETAARNFEKALKGLRPWAGSASDVVNLSLSATEARRVAEHWQELRDQHDTATRELRDARREYDRVAGRLAEFENDEAAAVDEEAKAARGNRDGLWSVHAKELTRETAGEFYASMTQDDALQEARLKFAERLARLRELQLDAASGKASLTSCERELASAMEVIDEDSEKLRDLLTSLGLPEGYDPRDLPDWQAALSAAQEQKSELDDKKVRLHEAAQSVDEAADQLRKALEITDEAAGLKELTKKSRAVAAQAADISAKAEARQKRLEEAQAEATRRSDEVVRLSGEIAQLVASWDREVTTLSRPLRTLDGFQWKLPTLRKLTSTLLDRDRLQRRIEAMKQDRKTFEDEIKRLGDRAGELIDASPLVLGERLRRRLQSARKSEEDLQKLNSKITDTEADVRSAEEELAALTLRVSEMAEVFDGAHQILSVDDLIEAIDGAKKADQLRYQSEELGDRILARLGASDLTEAEALLTDQDILELEGQKAGLANDLRTAEADHEEKVGDLRAARDDLERVGGDNAAAQLEEKRQTLLLDLEECARRSLRLRFGILAAEQALADYRDDHRSKMLSDTEAAFRKLTGGRYQDLQTQTDGQKEILLALRQQDSRSITVAEMSKGTRFQLYLALRMAGYRQYSSGGITLPFVADDIMETFDNTRTVAAVSLLREISQQGQALYFTHHEHVVDLAKEVCGDQLTVHDLVSQ